MKYEAVKVDQFSVQFATSRANDYGKLLVERALQFLADPEKKARLERSMCAWCYYGQGSRVAGQAFTTQPCGICGEDQTYSSTATNHLCLPCGKKHKLCVQCNGDVHMRVGRKFP